MSFSLRNKAKPSKVVSKDGTRPTLMHALLKDDGDETVLLATDSYRLIRLPVDVDDDQGVRRGWVPRDALAAAEKTGRFEVSDEFVEPLTRAGAKNGVLYRRTDPPKADSEPKWTTGELWPGEPKEPFVVGLNAAFLAEVADALGARRSAVTLHFDLAEASAGGWLKPILVTVEGSAARALLMPVRVS